MLNAFLVIILIAMSAFYGEQLKTDYLNTKRSSIVMLTNPEHTHGGTGFYVTTPSGKIVTLTNGHVCRLADDRGNIILDDGVKISTVKVVEQYEDNDLCIVEAPAYVTSGLTVARSSREAENIYVLGHPLLEPKALVSGQISGGMIAEVMQGVNMACEGKTYKKVPADPNDLMSIIMGIESFCIRTTEAEIVTANILPGNSGSPVLDTYGHVVGVAFAGTPGSGRGLIVPLHDVQAFLKGK